MATPGDSRTGSPPPPAVPVEPSTSEVLFDYPGADVVIRSHESQVFRVLKLYVVKSSTVLGGLIQAACDASGADTSARAQIQLPVVQLSERSAILSSLLTFIFPVTIILPSTLEETMELLSAAQKYEMSSTITHIRGSLSRKNSPFINPENAFIAYSLAQRYGLREEAIQAARVTLKFVLTIENLEDKLASAIMPGDYLHELWKYHQRVKAELWADPPSSGTGAAAVLKGSNCSQHTLGTCHPYWIELYIWSMIENPSLFDSIELQMALARHTAGVGGTISCVSCIHIPVETMRTFWTTLEATVHCCMEKAESELSIRRTETSPRSPPAVSLPLPECFDLSGADIAVRASDLTTFPIHKSVLAASSWVFRDMFALPRPPNSEMVNGLPVVDISEGSELVRSLITMLYPIPSEIPASYDKILALLTAAQKYDIGVVQSSIRAEVINRPPLVLDGAQAFRAYAIASRNGLTPEMEMAARLTLDQPMTFEHIGDELRLFEGRALSELARFRKACRDNIVSSFTSFLDINSDSSKIWVGCPTHWQPKSPLTLPTWLHDLFKSRIEELKQVFTCPLIKSSTIREKYLEALRAHAAPNRCTFCLGVHAMQGEWYCMQLEEVLSKAREKTPFISD